MGKWLEGGEGRREEKEWRRRTLEKLQSSGTSYSKRCPDELERCPGHENLALGRGLDGIEEDCVCEASCACQDGEGATWV